MKIVQIELPDKMAIQLEEMIKNGWFASEAEAWQQAGLLDLGEA